MIGSYKNRHVSGDPSAEGPQSSGGVGKPAPETQLQSQQEELERLKKDLSSQKVTSLLRMCVPPHQPPGPEGQSLAFVGLWMFCSPGGGGSPRGVTLWALWCPRSRVQTQVPQSLST